MRSTLAYSLGDPIPSGCKPYVRIQTNTGAEQWYTTCERPLPPTAKPEQLNIEQIQPVTPTTYMQKPSYDTPYLDPQAISFLTVLPLYLILTACAAFILLLFYLTSRYLLLRKKLKTNHVLLSIKPTHNTTESALSTEQLFTQLHSIIGQKTFLERLLHVKTMFSIELVATKKQGIRYLIYTPEDRASIIKKILLSYLPGIEIYEVTDYLSKDILESAKNFQSIGFVSYRLLGHFSIPLEQHTVLSLHDPIAYLTGNMTKLSDGELISLQLVLSPVDSASNRVKRNEAVKILNELWHGRDISQILSHNRLLSVLFFPIQFLGNIFYWSFRIVIEFISACFSVAYGTSKNSDVYAVAEAIQNQEKRKFVPTQTQQALFIKIQDKLEQPLFETNMRLLVIGNTPQKAIERIDGFTTTLAIFDHALYQQIIPKYHVLSSFIPERIKRLFLNFSLFYFTNRLLFFSQDMFLSVTELASIYHLPYTTTTKTEDLLTVKAKELPAPLSLKQSNPDIIFGINTYGGEITNVGLTDEERSRHVYIIGQTGSGKSTVMFHMAKDDIQKGRGVAVVDPHGDLAEDILATISSKRIKDFIYFNPYDIKYPVGINLLELPPGLDEDELELEKELVAEGVISIFRRVFSNDETTNAHRIEYILRNAIYTAFTIEKRTIFTVYDLLNNPDFRKKVVKNLDDENLNNFWKNEFEKAGNYQIIKMISGVTAKVGRFLFSPTAKRILEQEKSTINFDDILDNRKILICNVSEGKLGEDTSQLLGTTIITKIHQAAMRRARKNPKDRKPFYLFVDEFQNFATTSFTKLLSGGRKFGLRLTIAEQSTAQQKERNIVNVILANAGTVICFRTASPIDEELLLNQFAPYIETGELANLSRYHFYIKIGALDPQEPFSGRTLPIKIKRDKKLLEDLIESSRKLYAIKYIRKTTTLIAIKPDSKKKKAKKIINKIQVRSGAPV